MVDQELRHLEVSVAAGVVEGDEAALVLGVNIRPVLEQELHYPRPVVPRRQVKGSRLSLSLVRGIETLSGVTISAVSRSCFST